MARRDAAAARRAGEPPRPRGAGGMGAPLVSCIIPAYNYAGWIGAAIDSVLDQSQADDVEIVVVDDGSTDDTASVVAAYGDRVRYVWKENGGLVSAVDRGIAEARGTYLTLFDAADTWPAGRPYPLVGGMGARSWGGLVCCGHGC